MLSSINRPRMIPQLIFYLLGMLLVAPNLMADEAAQIRETWKKRTTAIKSFEFHVNSVKTKPVVVQGKTDLFGEPVDKNATIEVVALQSELTFRMANKEFSLRNVGQVWDESDKEIVTSEFQACYAGQREVTLLDGKRGAHGSIELHGKLEDSQVQNTLVVVFWLWYSPIEFLEARGYQFDDMKVVAGKLEHKGTECVELKIPRSGKKWMGYLYVDPARDYVPIRFVAQYQGTNMHECDIWYTAEKNAGWVVSNFVDSRFNESGAFDQTYSGEVQSASINEPIDGKSLTFEFPPGTQFIEQDGKARKYYIQEADGKRREIPSSEYGRLPDGEAT